MQVIRTPCLDAVFLLRQHSFLYEKRNIYSYMRYPMHIIHDFACLFCNFAKKSCISVQIFCVTG